MSKEVAMTIYEMEIVNLWMYADDLDTTISYLVVFSEVDLIYDEDGSLCLQKYCYYEI